MNSLTTFNFQSHDVRTVTDENGEPWFVAKDVCDVLEIQNPTDALKSLEEDERMTLDNTEGHSGKRGGAQFFNVVSESGLYALIFKSRKPEAKAFRKWVTAEVLPTIRKTGGYIRAAADETPEEIMARALFVAKDTIDRQKARIEEMKPKALFADAVASSKNSLLVGEMAKLLKQNGADIGQNRFFIWLRENGFLIRRQGSDYNMPTQRAMELGLFEIKEGAFAHSDGHVTITKTPKITGKGQVYFTNLFLKGQAAPVV